jgi:UDP-N-acetyl-D-mannosaminuronic acid dehydrogenase
VSVDPIPLAGLPGQRPLATPARDRHVCVIGLGYIGLPTAAMFAAAGKRVTGVDVNQTVVETVNRGATHIVEPDLDDLVRLVVDEGRLSAQDRPAPADAFLITVPTPVRCERGEVTPDLSYVHAATAAIAPVLKSGDLVVLESTSPVGTTRGVAELLASLRPDLSFPDGRGGEGTVDVAYSPERVIPGRTVVELGENDRVVGGMTPAASERAAALYGSFMRGTCLLTDDRTAEMVKLVENASRDTGIAFANELSMVCDDLGIDVWRVIELANRHPRVSILSPGAGVGGHCIAVDPWFIVASAPQRARLMRTAREVNDAKPHHVIARIEAALAARPGAKVACLGLAYKPDVDDFRESPALEIALELSAAHPGRVLCADPFAEALPERHRERLTLVETELALAWADVVVVLVGHGSFRHLKRPENKPVIDAVGFWR